MVVIDQCLIMNHVPKPQTFSPVGKGSKEFKRGFVASQNIAVREKESGELKASEIEDAEVRFIAIAQQKAFLGSIQPFYEKKELPKNSKLFALRPRLDEE